jgi:PEP-CTERM motif
MKKLTLATATIVCASMVAYSQGTVTVGNNDVNANGFVITSSSQHTAATATTYAPSSTFTIQLWQLPGNVTTTAGVAGLDAYGYLNIANLASDGFIQVANIGNVGGSGGVFQSPTAAILPGSTGAFPYSSAGSDVVALVGWTGSFANLATAIANNASVGILAFVTTLGPGGADAHIPNLYTGWNALQNSPLSAAKGGSQDFILAPVPEPSTLALAGLGGLASLMVIRRKKA